MSAGCISARTSACTESGATERPMALEQKLSVRMSQRLIMTPSLQQAIKLLQMSKLELVEEIQQELVENPVLEEALEEGPTGDRTEPEAPATEGHLHRERGRARHRGTRAVPGDRLRVYFQDVDTGYLPRPAWRRDELPSSRTRCPSPGPGRSPHLAARHVSRLRPAQGHRARRDRQPQRGRLPARHAWTRYPAEGDFTVEEVRATIEMMQGFDPVGVARARDLVECLTAQLKHLGEEALRGDDRRSHGQAAEPPLQGLRRYSASP